MSLYFAEYSHKNFIDLDYSVAISLSLMRREVYSLSGCFVVVVVVSVFLVHIH